jgi:hypothetical protein
MSNANNHYEPRSGKLLTPSGLIRNGIDEVTGCDISIDSDHANIHKGLAFSLPVNIGAVVAGVTKYISIDIPSGVYVHFKDFSIWTEGTQATLSVFEGATYTGGATVDPVNRNRVGTPVPSVVVCKSGLSTVDTSSAVLVENLVFGGGGGAASKAGGIGVIKPEMVLNPGTTYIFAIKNDDAVTSDIHVWFFWYEEGSGLA